MVLKASQFPMLDESLLEIYISRHADVTPALIAQQGTHFARIGDHVTDLACKPTFERIASVLFEFKRWPWWQSEVRDADTLYIPIMRTGIANYTGVKPETLSRAIRKLEQKKGIAIPRSDQVFMIDVPDSAVSKQRRLGGFCRSREPFQPAKSRAPATDRTGGPDSRGLERRSPGCAVHQRPDCRGSPALRAHTQKRAGTCPVVMIVNATRRSPLVALGSQKNRVCHRKRQEGE